MTREEALALLAKQQEEAIRDIRALAEKAEKYDQLIEPPDPGAPSGMTPTYQKENHRGRKKKPGRKKGHAGAFRKPAQSITDHLFIEFAKVDRRNNFLFWHLFRRLLSRLLKDAIHRSEKRPSFTAQVFQHRKSRLHARLNQFCAAIQVDDPDVQRLRKRLVRHRDELFTFLDHPEVSPDNNHVERQIRPLVIRRKISLQNRSRQGADTQAVLMSLFQTATLQGANPIDLVLDQIKATFLGPGQE